MDLTKHIRNISPFKGYLSLGSVLVLLWSSPGLLGSETKRASVTLEYRKIALNQVLHSLADQADFNLVYADALLEDIWVRCQFVDSPADQVLRELLENTPVDHRWARTGRVVLFARSNRSHGDFQGSVLGLNERPVHHALVTVGGTNRVASTDSQGRFRLRGIPQGSYEISIRAQDYLMKKLSLETVSASGIRVQLTPAPHLFEHMRVLLQEKGSVSISPTVGNVFIRPGENTTATGVFDLFEQLELLPGMNPANLGESGTGIRGSPPSQNLVLLDGIQLYQLDHALGYFSSINGDAIDGIHIFRGAYPAKYGSRLSGVMDVSTKSGPLARREISAGLNQDMGNITARVPLGDQVSALVSFRGSLSEDTSLDVYERVFERTFNEIPLSFQPESEINNSRHLDFSDTIAKLTWMPSSGQSFSFTFYDGEDQTDEVVDFDAQGQKLVVLGRQGRWGNSGYSMTWQRRWSPRLDMQARVVWSQYKSDFDFQELIFPEEDEEFLDELETVHSSVDSFLEESSLGLDINYDFNEHHVLSLGFARSSLRAKAGVLLPLDDVDFRQDDETKRNSFYLQDSWAREGFQVVGGIRIHNNRLTDSQFVEPRLSLAADISDRWTARAGWGRYHQDVLRIPGSAYYFEGAQTWFLADEYIEPATSQHGHVGVAYRSPAFSMDLELFEKRHEGTIIQRFDSDPDSDLLQASGIISGLDLSLQKQKGRYSGSFHYGYQRSRIRGDLHTEEEFDYPDHRERPHSLKLSGSFQGTSWSVASHWRYASGRPFSIPELFFFEDDRGMLQVETVEPEIPNGHRLPATHQLDVNGQYRFSLRNAEARLSLTLFNVYDRRNPLYRYYQNDNPTAPVDVLGFGFQPRLSLQVTF